MLIIRAKVMRLVGVMYDLESIASRIQVLISDDLVTNNVDISLDFRFLPNYSSEFHT